MQVNTQDKDKLHHLQKWCSLGKMYRGGWGTLGKGQANCGDRGHVLKTVATIWWYRIGFPKWAPLQTLKKFPVVQGPRLVIKIHGPHHYFDSIHDGSADMGAQCFADPSPRASSECPDCSFVTPKTQRGCLSLLKTSTPSSSFFTFFFLCQDTPLTTLSPQIFGG